MKRRRSSTPGLVEAMAIPCMSPYVPLSCRGRRRGSSPDRSSQARRAALASMRPDQKDTTNEPTQAPRWSSPNAPALPHIGRGPGLVASIEGARHRGPRCNICCTPARRRSIRGRCAPIGGARSRPARFVSPARDVSHWSRPPDRCAGLVEESRHGDCSPSMECPGLTHCLDLSPDYRRSYRRASAHCSLEMRAALLPDRGDTRSRCTFAGALSESSRPRRC